MKRITIIISALLICSGGAFAQDVQKAAEEVGTVFASEIFADRAYEDDGTLVARSNEKVDNTQFWTKGVDFDLGFNQTGLFNWAAGGYNTLSLAAGIDGKAIYTRDLMSWNNRLQLNYGHALLCLNGEDGEKHHDDGGEERVKSVVHSLDIT